MQWANVVVWRLPYMLSDAGVARLVESRYRPLVGQLLANPQARMTLDLNGALTERLALLGHTDVLEGLRTLLERGQIELTGSAMHHPLLPLLPADEAMRQIRLNLETNRRLLGAAYQPRGFFPPEMAVSPDLLRLVRQEGFAWVILDEIAYSGRLGDAPRDRICEAADAAGLRLVFRDRAMSVNLAFGGLPDGRAFLEAAAPRWREGGVLVTASGAEPEHSPAVRYDRLLDDLVDCAVLTVCTVSEAVAGVPVGPAIAPRASSWCADEADLMAGAPFAPWLLPGYALHEAQQRLTREALRVVRSAPRGSRPAGEARQRLDPALHCAPYWWGSGRPWWNPGLVRDGAEQLRQAAGAVALVPGAQQVERAYASVVWLTDLLERDHSGDDRASRLPLPQGERAGAAPPDQPTDLRSPSAWEETR